MKTLITGHRLFKLENYSYQFIRSAIANVLSNRVLNTSYGLSGMASGVDLWFCAECLCLDIPYQACIPFRDQDKCMEMQEAQIRDLHIDHATCVKNCRNSQMLEESDNAIVVWDGNKGGTHNVVQQLIEKDKPWIWINPVGEKIWKMI
tara:strand:+ start:30251 stop:30694 length:444 start_codon:yes stop_codon:yes gene_type:complete